MFLHKVSKGTSSNEIDFFFEPPVMMAMNNFVEPAPVPQRAGNLKRNKAAARAFNNQQEESDSSSKLYEDLGPNHLYFFDGRFLSRHKYRFFM